MTFTDANFAAPEESAIHKLVFDAVMHALKIGAPGLAHAGKVPIALNAAIHVDAALATPPTSVLPRGADAEPVADDEGKPLPTYGNLPWDHIGRDVMEALTDRRVPFKFDEKFYPGHQSTGINFNSLARIIDKYRLAGSWQGIAPDATPPVSDASRLRALADLFSESAHETWTKDEIVSIIEETIRMGLSPAGKTGGVG